VRIPSVASRDFWRLYRRLPRDVRRLAAKSYKVWQQDPFHPSLHFKKVGDDLWSVRVGGHHRALGRFHGQAALGVSAAAVTSEAVIRVRSISSRKILVRAATAAGRSASMPRNHLGTEITHCRTGTGGLTLQEMRWRAILASILQPDGC